MTQRESEGVFVDRLVCQDTVSLPDTLACAAGCRWKCDLYSKVELLVRVNKTFWRMIHELTAECR